jgi:hypothetical protein
MRIAKAHMLAHGMLAALGFERVLSQLDEWQVDNNVLIALHCASVQSAHVV